MPDASGRFRGIAVPDCAYFRRQTTYAELRGLKNISENLAPWLAERFDRPDAVIVIGRDWDQINDHMRRFDRQPSLIRCIASAVSGIQRIQGMSRNTEVIVLDWPSDGPDGGLAFRREVRTRFNVPSAPVNRDTEPPTT